MNQMHNILKLSYKHNNNYNQYYKFRLLYKPLIYKYLHNTNYILLKVTLRYANIYSIYENNFYYKNISVILQYNN